MNMKMTNCLHSICCSIESPRIEPPTIDYDLLTNTQQYSMKEATLTKSMQ